MPAKRWKTHKNATCFSQVKVIIVVTNKAQKKCWGSNRIWTFNSIQSESRWSLIIFSKLYICNCLSYFITVRITFTCIPNSVPHSRHRLAMVDLSPQSIYCNSQNCKTMGIKLKVLYSVVFTCWKLGPRWIIYSCHILIILVLKPKSFFSNNTDTTLHNTVSHHIVRKSFLFLRIALQDTCHFFICSALVLSLSYIHITSYVLH